MKKNQQIVKDCEDFFEVFNGTGGLLADEIANVTNEPCRSVCSFLEEQGKKQLYQSCLDVWNKIIAISFTSGFMMASILDPNSKASLKGIQKLASAIKKMGILPIYEEEVSE